MSSPLASRLSRLLTELRFSTRTFGLAQSQTHALAAIADELEECVGEAEQLHRLVLETPPAEGELERGDVLATVVHPHLESERGRS